jgi:hypothetical protein
VPFRARDSEGRAVDAALAGRTADGDQVFLFTAGNLVRINALKGNCDVVPLSGPQPSWVMLPSPDGRLLASVVYERTVSEFAAMEDRLALVDTLTGRVTMLRKGVTLPRYSYSAVGWSAKTPGRLYFTDELDRLWRVDLPASRTGTRATR